MTEAKGLVVVVDDDASVRKSLGRLLRSAGYTVQTCESAEDYLANGAATPPTCVILDLAMPGQDGIQLQDRLLEDGAECGIVFLTGHGSLDIGIRAMKHGAVDFLSKPIDETRLLDAVEESFVRERQRLRDKLTIEGAQHHFETLTRREHEVMELMIAGSLNKIIAAELGISEKTVKAHRANVMHKTGARSVAELVRLYIAAQG